MPKITDDSPESKKEKDQTVAISSQGNGIQLVVAENNDGKKYVTLEIEKNVLEYMRNHYNVDYVRVIFAEGTAVDITGYRKQSL